MFKTFFKKSKYLVLFFVLFSTITLAVFYQLLKVDKTLKIYNPIDVNPRLVDVSKKYQQRNHTIADFSLVNQNGDTITQDTFANKIYIADFFFTRCQNICIAMAYHMKQLQDTYANEDELLFLSHSVTPKIDSVPVLQTYAQEKGAIAGKWHITTGDKAHIYDLARKSYFAVLDEGNGDENDFIHTEQFVLIDKERRIRGYYDGTDPKAIEALKKDLVILKESYK